jgi:hypothetical protein
MHALEQIRDEVPDYGEPLIAWRAGRSGACEGVYCLQN